MDFQTGLLYIKIGYLILMVSVFALFFIFWYKLIGNKKTKQIVKIREFDELEDWIEKYKEVRRENATEIDPLMRKFLLSKGIITILFILFVVLLWKGRNLIIINEWLMFLIVLSVSLAYILSLLYFYIKSEDIQEKIKKIWVGKFISTVTPNTSYQPSIIAVPNYRRVYDVPQVYTSVVFEDSILGEGYEIVDVEESHGSGKRKVVIFRGSFTIIDVKKSFPHLFICSKQNHILGKKNILQVDNERFNHYFEIQVKENQEQIGTCLSKSLLDYLADFYEQFGILFDVTFDDKIYVRFYTGDMYRPSIWKNKVDKQSIYKYYCITKFIKDIQEIMK